MDFTQDSLWKGVILTQRQYLDFGCREYQRNVIRPLDNSSNDIERVYFSLSSGFNIVIGDSAYLQRWIRSGYLLDLRDREFENVTEFSLYVHSMMHSRSERIMRCNLLRAEIFSRAKVRFRNCGPEMETLSDPVLACKASEHVGLYERGFYFDGKGIHDDLHWEMKSDKFQMMFMNVNDDSELDLGQKKLYFVMLGFALKRDIVYVGAAPGLGWQKALLDMGWEGTVWAFDPRDLSCTTMKGVRHSRILVSSFQDIENIVTSDSYDFIWDVRGDFVSNEQYHKMVSEEIITLNTILRGLKRCQRMNIKISSAHISEYVLPSNGRFFYQPYCYERGVSELRFVSRWSIPYKVEDCAVHAINLWKSDFHSKEYRYTDYELSFNMLLMRLDYGNYMTRKRCSDVVMDINLFSINRNSPVEMVHYFNDPFPKIVSKLVKRYLDSTEFDLNEVEVLDLERHSITHPRCFIGLDIPGLRLIVPKCLSIMKDEFVHNDGQIIKSEMTTILKGHSCRDYDEARSRCASDEDFRFVRYPNSFSVFDDLGSVSGHMLRVTHASYHDRASLFAYTDKVIYNFNLYNKMEDWNQLPNYLEIGDLCRDGLIESKIKVFWHSTKEWLAGYRAGCALLNVPVSIRFVSSLRKILDSPKLGKETYEWKRDNKIDTYYSSYKKCIAKGYLKPLSDTQTFEQWCEYLVGLVQDPRCVILYPKDRFLSFKNNKSDIDTAAMRHLRIDAVVRDLYIKSSIVHLISKGRVKDHYLDRCNWLYLLSHALSKLGIRDGNVIETAYQEWLSESALALNDFEDWSENTKQSYLYELLASNWIENEKNIVFWRPIGYRSMLPVTPIISINRDLNRIYDDVFTSEDVFYLYDAEIIYEQYDLGLFKAP